MKKTFLFLILIFIVHLSYGQLFTEIAKSLPQPYWGAVKDNYGSSVSVDGDYTVVGAEKHLIKGCAYVLYNTGSTWDTVATLEASDTFAEDNFGCSVSISGDVIVVGAYQNDDNGTNSGSAYVFAKPASGWKNMTQTAKLTAADGASGDNFGYSVSIFEDVIVVGATGDDDNGINSGSAFVFKKPASGWTDMTQTAKLTASDGASKDYFGYSVNIFGDVIVIGAYDDDDNGSNSGSAYVFEKPIDGWVDITQVAKLTAADGEEYDYFGFSVSISEDVIVVGATGDDNNGMDLGSAYVFGKPTGGWVDTTETAKLTSSDGESKDNFGYSVSISGDVIVVGATGDDDNGMDLGSAYVFEKPTSGWVNTTETAKLTSSDGESEDYFGCSVSISGDVIVVGAYGDDDNGSNTGSVYLFKKPSNTWLDTTETYKKSAKIYLSNIFNNYGYRVAIDGNYSVITSTEDTTGIVYVLFYDGNAWITQAKLTASDEASGDYFGCSVSISGNVIVVGAYGDDVDNQSLSGSAYVFVKPSGGWTNMTQTAKLKHIAPRENDYFGYSVDIFGNRIAVGAPGDEQGEGAVCVFRRPATGWADMTYTAKLTNSKYPNNHLGYSVSISGDVVVAGAIGGSSNDSKSGSAYVFKKPIGGWADMTETAKLTASDGEEYDYFGCSVDISGDIIVAGAYQNDDNGTNSGSAYVYEKPSGGWIDTTEIAKLTTSDGVSEDNFGCSVSISGDVIVVGAYQDDDNGNSSGSAYVFIKPSGAWRDTTETLKLIASDAEAEDEFGISVGISGYYIVVGADKNDDNDYNSGSAYLFNKCPEIKITDFINKNATCGNEDGQSKVNVTGGTGDYTYQWSTSPEQTTNPATELAPGSYTVTVVDNDNSACSIVGNTTITISASPIISIVSEADTVCLNGSVTLTASSTESGTTYEWITTNGIFNPVSADINPINLNNITANTTVTVKGTKYGCSDTKSITIEVYPEIVISNIIKKSEENQVTYTVEFDISGGDITSYTVNGIFSGSHYKSSDINSGDSYSFTITDKNDCNAKIINGIDSTSFPLEEKEYNIIYIPNIFSPNNDGENDILYVRGTNIKSFYFVIFDRWGELIFETENQSKGWDGTFKGKEVDPAVFVYYYIVEFNDGKTLNNHGNITLVK